MDSASGHHWFYRQGYTPHQAREQSNHGSSSYVQCMITRAARIADKREATASTLYLGRLTVGASKKAAMRSQSSSFGLLQLGSGSSEHEEDTIEHSLAQDESGHCVSVMQQLATKVATRVICISVNLLPQLCTKWLRIHSCCPLIH